MPHTYERHTGTQGFTLIEMSIVLMVIGLLVGGILVGQDLIHAAQIRQTISQIEKLNSAVNTFKLKFNGIPGDIDPTTANAYGLKGANGLISNYWDNGFVDGYINEDAYSNFYQDLVLTNLVACVCTPSNNPSTYTLDQQFLVPQLNKGAFFVYGGIDPWLGTNPPAGPLSYNYIEIYPIIPGTLSYAITPYEAYAIDLKIDDGLPMSGKALAQKNNTAWNWSSPWYPSRAPTQGAGGPNASFCVSTSTTPSSYNVQNNVNLCTLQIRAGF